MRYWNLKFVDNKAGVKFPALQNCAGKKKHTFAKKKHTKSWWNIKCALQYVFWPKHTLARCVFFYQYSYKVAAIWLTYHCVLILVVGIIIDYVSWKHCLNLKKDYKNWGPNFWSFNHFSSVVQTASYQNLQKFLKFKL